MLIIKKLRREKSINQSELAAIIGVSLRTIQLYEKVDANIPIKNLTKIADFFEIGIDRLFAREVNESASGYDHKHDHLTEGHTIQKLGPGKYLLSAPLLMGKEQLEQFNAIENQYSRTQLPRIGFMLDRVSRGTYVAFEVVNNAMDNGLANRIPQGSCVLGKRVSEKELAKTLKEYDSFWILVCTTTIMCKKITAYHKKEKLLCCHSINDSPEYPDFNVPLAEVTAFFRIIKKQLD